MALDDEIIKVFDSNPCCSSEDDDDIDDLYHELYDSLVRAKKELKLKIIKNESLVQKIKCLKKENHDLNLLLEQLLSQNTPCVECKILKDKNLELIKSFQNFTNSKNTLHAMLENQHNIQNKKGLGFNKRRYNKERSKGFYKIASKIILASSTIVVIKEVIILGIIPIGMELMC